MYKNYFIVGFSVLENIIFLFVCCSLRLIKTIIACKMDEKAIAGQSLLPNDKPGSSKTPKNISMITRKSSDIFGFGQDVSSRDSDITGSRLPTGRQILRCMMFHVKDGLSTRRQKWDSAKIVLSKTTPFYRKGHIPMIDDRNACIKILELLEDNSKLRAIPIARRKTSATIAKLQHHDEELSKTFQLWPRSAEKKIRIPEDVSFLQSMQTDRKASFGGVDSVLGGNQKRKVQRELLEIKRREAAQAEMATLSTTATATLDVGIDSEDSNECEDDTDDAYGENLASTTDPTASKSQRKHRRVREGTKAFIPHNILQSPKLVSLATRMKLTPTQQAAFTKAFIEEAGGDVSKVSTSYAQADKLRRSVGHQIMKTCREEWDPPKLCSLHWDSKLLPSLTNQYNNEERLAVAVGDINDIKLLGVPRYKPGTNRNSGEIITELTFDLLQAWNCADSVCNMVFDTTASNTGHVSAACIQIQQRLGRGLLWSGCRHHVGEVILSHVFEDLKVETSKSPDVMVFSRLRKHWNLVPHDSELPLGHLNICGYSDEAQIFISAWRDEVLQLAYSQIDFKRDDYEEFLQLCVVYLDPDSPATTFKSPGALHKARWMAKLLYSIKIVLFQQQIAQLPSGTITTKQQVPKLRDFVTFATLIYSSWWTQSSCSTDAAWNDLMLYKRLLMYEAVHPGVSKSAIKAFNRHLWYLTGELVPLALFSSRVPDDDKRQLADKLVEVKPTENLQIPTDRFGTGFGKPKFPSKVTSSSTLADFVTTDSWYFFHLLQLDSSFLVEEVGDWDTNASYQAAKVNIQAINVINDSAERSVKLSSDFLASARSESHYQDVLQVVERDRKETPNLRKRKHKDTQA